MTTESEVAAAQLVAFLKTKLGPEVEIHNIDDGDVTLSIPDVDQFMIHVEYL